MKKLSLILLVAMVIFITLIGCDGVDVDEEDLLEEQGDLAITATIPEQIQPQEIGALNYLEEVELDKIQFNIERGEISHTETITTIDGSDEIEIVFDELSIGTWDIEVTAIDTEEHEIALGTEEATVTPKDMTDVKVIMELLEGELNLQIDIGENDIVESGEVILSNKIDNIDDIEKSVEANEQTVIEISDVVPALWDLNVELYDNEGEIVVSEERTVTMLPGRTKTVTISFAEGELNISIDWILPPDNPQSVTAEYSDEIVTVSWDEVDGATGYAVYKSTVEGKPQGSTDLITQTEYTDDAVEKDTTYWYWVVAYNESLSSGFSEPAQVYTGEEAYSDDYFGLVDGAKLYYKEVGPEPPIDTGGENAIIGEVIEDGEPVEGVTVLLENMDTNETMDATTDEDGRYEIIGVSEGNSKISLLLDDTVYEEEIYLFAGEDYYTIKEINLINNSIETDQRHFPKEDVIISWETSFIETTEEGIDIFETIEKFGEGEGYPTYRTRYNNEYYIFHSKDDIYDTDEGIFLFKKPISEGDKGFMLPYDDVEPVAQEKEELTIEAGTFSAWRFNHEEEFEEDKGTVIGFINFWVVPYLGLVKIEEGEKLMENGDIIDEESYGMELVDYEF